MPYKDPEKNKAAQRKSAEKHRLKNKKRLADLYRANRNKMKRRSQKWREDNRQRMLATLREYRHKNPAYTLWISARYRAKKSGFPFALAVEDIFVPEFCPVLGIKIAHGNANWAHSSPSLDRIKGDLGYVKDNVRVISWRANCLKRDGTLEEFERIVAYLRGEL